MSPVIGTVAPTRLSWFRKIGYAAGDFGLNLFFTFSTLFLLYYYTDVLGLTATTAGLIIMVALVWEGLFDPLMGVLATRTRSRFGRYRPYLLYGALPLCLSFVAMFVPTGLSGTSLAAYALVTHLLFRTAYTVVGIPFISLSAEMSRDSQERSEIAGARMLFAMGCGLTLAAVTLPLSGALGGGQRGFFGLSIIYAIVALAIFLICFSVTRETTGRRTHAPTLREMTRMVRTNRPLLLLLSATVLASIGSTLASKTLLYYLKYDVGSEAAVTPALTIATACAAVSVPLWVMITAKSSKRAVWLTGATIAIANSLLFYALAPRVGPLLWIILGAGGIANGAFYLTFWSMVPDTVEYGEWKTGVRAEGAIYGLVSLTQKVALGLGVGLLGILLDAIGYRANAVQDASTLHGVRILLTLAPAMLSVGVALIIWFYPIDRPFHARLTSDLADRKSIRTEPSPSRPSKMQVQQSGVTAPGSEPR